MPVLAHHGAEQSLVPLLVLLLGGGGIPILVSIGRARAANARTRLSRRPRVGHRRRGGMPRWSLPRAPS